MAPRRTRGAQGMPVLRRLRRKIVAIVMLLTGVILVSTNLVGFFALTSSLDTVVRKGLEVAASAGPSAFDTPWVGGKLSDDASHVLEQESGQDAHLSFTIYCASIDGEGIVLASNEDSVSIRADVLEQALDEAIASEKDYGRIDELNLMFARDRTSTGYTVALLDTTSLDSVVESSFWSMVQRTVAAGALLLAVSVVLARYATAPIARTLQQQQQFVSDASHELKTPITVILASADILRKQRGRSGSDDEKWLSSITDEATRMKSLVDELVAAARAAEESDNARAERKNRHERVNLSELVERSALQFEAVAFERGIDFTWDVAPGQTLLGNAAELERLTKILLDNAMKYAEAPATSAARAGADGEAAPDAAATASASWAGGRCERACVRLELAKSHERIEVRVRNTGEPIDPEKLPHLFDRFYRADESRTDSSSFGLGLFIAQSIAQSHKGTLSVSSTYEHGTVFTATLPAESSLSRLLDRGERRKQA